jgi:hypothetical protein
MQIDEKAFEAARAAWLESASDYTRLDQSIKAAIAAYLESAKPKEAEGLKLGSRLTVEGAEAVVVPVEPTEEMVRVSCAVDYPASYRQYLRHPMNGTSAAAATEKHISSAKARYRAMLSAAGDGR